jgi:hypothetical protein
LWDFVVYLCTVTIEEKAKFVADNIYTGLAFQVHGETKLAYKTCVKYAKDPFAQNAKCFRFVAAAYELIKKEKQIG